MGRWPSVALTALSLTWCVSARAQDPPAAGPFGVIPPVPAGCEGDLHVRSLVNTQKQTIAPDSRAGVLVSTIEVSDMGPSLWDLNLQTFITYDYNADLEITLQSPAGTIVTISSRNGVAEDVFNGTIWDDQADPGGQVPYETNNGLVTDHAYTGFVTASPLVPEEAMGAFIGENPNGTWTLTISHEFARLGGSLNSWVLQIAALDAAPLMHAPQFFASADVPKMIPAVVAVVSSVTTVSGIDGMICDVDVITSITHSFAADLDITLTSPSGTIVTLTTDNGGGNDDVFNGTVWNDDANPGGQVPYVTNNGLVTDQAYANHVVASPLVPEEAMAAFIGENPNGVWRLTISDDSSFDGGSLNSWILRISTCACSPCLLAKDNCLAPHAEPGCSDTGCCSAVCTIDQFCCASEWDRTCAAEATAMCGCGAPKAGSCLKPDGSPGCDDALCCATICGIDQFCCTMAWDSGCADMANLICGEPANDSCDGANAIACGQTTLGATMLATTENPAPPGCGPALSAPGVWFTVTGTGASMTATTCGLAGYDTIINVYAGPCTALVCVGGNDNDPRCAQGNGLSTVTWQSLSGAPYRILVQGHGGQTGAFRLGVSCEPTCPDPELPADLNCDGVVNTIDLGGLLASWSIPARAPGCGGTQPCPADINHDGVVNTLDLGILLASWTL